MSRAMITALLAATHAATLAATADRAAAAAPSGTWSLSSPTLNASLSIIPTSGVAILSYLSIFSSSAWTINLAAGSGSIDDSLLSGAAIVDASGAGWVAFADAATVVSANESSISISGLLHGPSAAPFAREDWTLSLSAAEPPTVGVTLSWRVTRAWLAAVNVSSDRLALGLCMTGAPPIHGYQIPSFLDSEMFMRGTGGFPLPGSFYEFGSNTTSQLVVFTPVFARVWSELDATRNGEGAPAYFSFAKPFADGTATHASLGGNLVDRRAGSTPASPGDAQTAEWRLTLVDDGAAPPANPFPTLNLTLPPALANVSAATQLFANVHNQFMGCAQAGLDASYHDALRTRRVSIPAAISLHAAPALRTPCARRLRSFIFGNNPASVPCLQEMAFFAWIQGMFDASNLQHGVSAVQKEINFFGSCGWDDGTGHSQCTPAPGSGLLMQRWASPGFYNVRDVLTVRYVNRLPDRRQRHLSAPRHEPCARTHRVRCMMSARSRFIYRYAPTLTPTLTLYTHVLTYYCRLPGAPVSKPLRLGLQCSTTRRLRAARCPRPRTRTHAHCATHAPLCMRTALPFHSLTHLYARALACPRARLNCSERPDA